MRLLFLYNCNWEKEIADYARGMVPSHRLFGFAEAARFGHQPRYCPMPRWAGPIVRKPRWWRVYQAIFALLHQRKLDAVIATHEASALPALVLRRLGLLRTPLIVISVALLHPKNCRGLRKKMWRWSLAAADAIVSYASAHKSWIAAEFAVPPERLATVPLGVDTAFFAPQDCPTRDRFCLSVGTNDGKDFATLIRGLPKETKLTVVTDGPNASLIRQIAPDDARIEVMRDVPIDRLRDLYQAAAVHVIPLAETRFSSGQTVLLENMSLGKVVIVTDTSATRDYVTGGETALVVPPSDPQRLRERIEAVLRDPARFRRVGDRAAGSVREQFSAEHSAKALLAVASRVASNAESDAFDPLIVVGSSSGGA